MMIHRFLFGSFGMGQKTVHIYSHCLRRPYQTVQRKPFVGGSTEALSQNTAVKTGQRIPNSRPCYPCKNFSTNRNPSQLDPNKETRRQKLTIATYVSGFIGICLLSAIGVRYYGRMKRRAMGIEEMKVPEYSYGRRPQMYKYRGYIFSTMFFDKLRDIHGFEVREDDIWLVTFPKAGTTWVQEIVYLVMNEVNTEKSQEANLFSRFPYFEYPVPGLETINRMESPRLIKSHLPFSILPNQMKTKKPKIIYVARNPKDTAVSFYSFAVKFLNTIPFTGSFEDYCRLFATDKVFYGPWWKHVAEAWSKKDDDNVLFLFYEDLHMDIEGNVRVIAEFLGRRLSDDQVATIVRHCSFENMKNNASVNYEWLKADGIATGDAVFMRKGKVGDWKNHLSEDIVKQLDEMVATKLPADIPIRDSLPEQ